MANDTKEKNTTYIGKEALHNVEEDLNEVEEDFREFEHQQSRMVRTLQIMVYPAMIAFITLAAYGFYLVQSLTTDVHRLTETIASMQRSVDRGMQNISGSVDHMSLQMDSMARSTHTMSSLMGNMDNSTQDIAYNMRAMNASTHNMNASMYNMQSDVGHMNRSFSNPMKMMTNFMPFFGSKSRRVPVNPPQIVPSYPQNGYYAQQGYGNAQARGMQVINPVITTPANHQSINTVVKPTQNQAAAGRQFN